LRGADAPVAASTSQAKSRPISPTWAALPGAAAVEQSRFAPPPTTEATMRVVGYLTSAVVALGAVASVVIIVGSLPDIRRYLRISRM
jgi:hypothetical protein